MNTKLYRLTPALLIGRLSLLLCLANFNSSCGSSKNDGTEQEIVKGIAVSGSTVQGLAFTTVSMDLSFASSSLYFYDFKSGDVKKLLSGESGNPAVFWADDLLFHFNSKGNQLNFRVFDPREENTPIPSASDLPSLSEGDPFALVTLQTSKSVLLASPIAGALQSLNYLTGNLETVDIDNLPQPGIRPVDLYRSANNIYALNTGVNTLDEVDGNQQVFVFETSPNSSSLTPVDINTGTTTLDGLKIIPSYPTAFVDDAAAKPYIVGLCRSDLTGCVGGANRLDPSTPSEPKITDVKTFTSSLGYTIVNRIVRSSKEGVVYAHVKSTSDSTYQVIELNLSTQSATTVHTFSDARLYGMFYDSGSRTLFVGDVDGLMGTMTLYRDNSKIGQFELSEVPQKGAFVPL
jgi:hypothetical protein